jgi:hypothetical protein
MFIVPLRSEEYARDLPSGDHAGSVSYAGSAVSRRGVPSTGMSQRSPRAQNAT